MEALSQALRGKKVVLVHDWLTGMRGGEKVLECFCRLFPKAPLYTLLHNRGSVSPIIENREIISSFIQKLPLASQKYRHYLPLFPAAASSLKIPPCDLVLSSSHCVAKAVKKPAGAVHASYLHTPMRYIWDMYEQYFGPGRGGLAAYVMPGVRPFLQHWDVKTCNRVDHFLANSDFVAGRISRIYGRKSQVIHPPVDLARFTPLAAKGDYYLVLSALVPYKRVDIAVQACRVTGRKLKVVGTGPELESLRQGAGAGVEFLGWQDDEAVAELYAGAKALLFPGVEDFGITPLEAMASGTPVVALQQGGALETVIGLDDPAGRPPTGVFFGEQTPDSLARALDRLEAERDRFAAGDLAAHAAGFDNAHFMAKMAATLAAMLTKS